MLMKTYVNFFRVIHDSEKLSSFFEISTTNTNLKFKTAFLKAVIFDAADFRKTFSSSFF